MLMTPIDMCEQQSQAQAELMGAVAVTSEQCRRSDVVPKSQRRKTVNMASFLGPTEGTFGFLGLEWTPQACS